MAEVLVEHPPHADGQTALLYERYGTRIYRFCLSRLRSREEAEDAVQSTFLRAHGALRQGVVPHSETAWLFKIAQNVCVTRAVASSRRTRLEHAADLEQVNERVPAAQGQHDELIGLSDALAKMPANLRRPFLLREWKGLSYAEIAEDLGVSQSAVETLIFRARRHLAGALDVTGSRLRRAVKALNLGPVLDLMRSLLAGGGAKVAAVAALATVGAVGAVGVTALPGSNSRAPGAPAQVTPNGAPGAVPQSTAGGSPGAGRSSSPNARPGAAANEGNAAGFAGLRASGGRLTGTSSPTSSVPRAGTPAGAPPAAGPTTGAAPSSNSSAPTSSGSPTAGAPSGSSGASTPPIVVVPPVPVTPPSGSGGLPEVPVPPLPPLPEVPIPQVPSIPPVPVPQVPPVSPPAVPPLPPSLTPPPLPVPPPSVPPVPSVPPLPQPPPLPQVVPPPPPVLPPVPPPPPLP